METVEPLSWVRTSRSRIVALSLIRNNLVRSWLVTCWPDNVTRNQRAMIKVNKVRHETVLPENRWGHKEQTDLQPMQILGGSRAESLTGDLYWLSLIWPSGSRGAARLSSGKYSFLGNFGAQRLISNPRNCWLHIKPPWVLRALTCSPSKADANVSNSAVPR